MPAVAAPIALYVHVPYCRRICPYCDFNVHVMRPHDEQDDLDAYRRELDTHAGAAPWAGATVGTIYFGGGTPTLLEPSTIAAVIEHVAARFTLAGDAEISIEANPGTVSEASLGALHAAGVTRLSLGAQSFDDDVLRALGRDHRAAEIPHAVAAARVAGFANVSFDLIYAAPGQPTDRLAADLAAAVALTPEHVSAYELTYEPGTAFHRQRAAGRLAPASDDDVATMDALVAERLTAAGYARYEISSYARPGFECRHNQRYWDGSSYLGIGPGAHSFAAEPLPGRRWVNVRRPPAYRAQVAATRTAVDAVDELTLARATSDFVVTGLRRLAGADARAFEQRFGTTLEHAFPQLRDLAAEGLITITRDRVRLSARGLRFADSVGARLV